jgi:hypothetical protein
MLEIGKKSEDGVSAAAARQVDAKGIWCDVHAKALANMKINDLCLDIRLRNLARYRP